MRSRSEGPAGDWSIAAFVGPEQSRRCRCRVGRSCTRSDVAGIVQGGRQRRCDLKLDVLLLRWAHTRPDSRAIPVRSLAVRKSKSCRDDERLTRIRLPGHRNDYLDVSPSQASSTTNTDKHGSAPISQILVI
nr:hypothetical protein CFP56_04461 [Quercus suber]